MTIPFLDLKAQYQSIKAEMDAAVSEVISSASFIGGKYVTTFEQDFAQYIGKDLECVGVANGTDALEVSIEALELPQGSEIIVPANSFIASSEAVTRQGHRVVFCDVDPNTYLIDIANIEKCLTHKTAAIIAVHLYGQPCNMPEIVRFAQQKDLKVIEDAAQAHGASFENQNAGSMGDISCFSFYPGKNLGAYGDGGAILSKNSELLKRCKMIANHGRVEKYNHEFEGRNSRLDALQAAVLSVKLRHLPDWIAIRRQRASEYLNLLRPLEEQGYITLPYITPNANSAWHLFVIRTEKRDDLRQFLSEKEIQTGIHYPIALPKLAAYSYLNQAHEQGFAWQKDEHLLSLPIGEHLSSEDILTVCQAVNQFFST